MKKATHAGELKIGNILIPCAVLDDGTRLLTQGGFLKAIGRSRTPKAGTGATVAQTATFVAANNLKPFVDKDLIASTKAIVFLDSTGRSSVGYRAELLPKVCEVFLAARDAKAIRPSQKHIVERCDVLVRGLAHVGIAALVDEATGYQAVRARDALERILEQFIAKEYRKWLKTFPDEFYEQMYRLKKWSLNSTSPSRPQVVGKYTNDLVYQRLAPGVLEELRKKNPKTQSGNRNQRHHQWLTDDSGHPQLRTHLAVVVALMKASSNWDQFKRSMDKAVPRYMETMELDLDEQD